MNDDQYLKLTQTATTTILTLSHNGKLDSLLVIQFLSILHGTNGAHTLVNPSSHTMIMSDNQMQATEFKDRQNDNLSNNSGEQNDRKESHFYDNSNVFDGERFLTSCRRGDLKYIRSCDYEYCNIMIHDRFGRNAFHFAAISSGDNCDSNNNTNVKNKSNEKKRLKLIKYLFDKLYFVTKGNKVGIKSDCNQASLMLNTCDIYGLTPLHYASFIKDNDQVINIIIEKLDEYGIKWRNGYDDHYFTHDLNLEELRLQLELEYTSLYFEYYDYYISTLSKHMMHGFEFLNLNEMKTRNDDKELVKPRYITPLMIAVMSGSGRNVTELLKHKHNNNVNEFAKSIVNMMQNFNGKSDYCLDFIPFGIVSCIENENKNGNKDLLNRLLFNIVDLESKDKKLNEDLWNCMSNKAKYHLYHLLMTLNRLNIKGNDKQWMDDVNACLKEIELCSIDQHSVVELISLFFSFCSCCWIFFACFFTLN